MPLANKSYLREEFNISRTSLETGSSAERCRRFQQFHVDRRPIDVLNEFLQQRVREPQLDSDSGRGLLCIGLRSFARSVQLVTLVLEVLEEFLRALAVLLLLLIR